MKVTHNTHPINIQKPAIKKPKSTPLEANPPAGSAGEISEEARLFQKATELVKAAPDVREDKVKAVKKRLADGSYNVSSASIAEKLVEDHVKTDFGKNKI